MFNCAFSLYKDLIVISYFLLAGQNSTFQKSNYSCRGLAFLEICRNPEKSFL
jgi:hypothetical protein